MSANSPTSATQRTSAALARRAIFLDRDGTLIVDKHYLRHPDDVDLLPHAANAVRRFNYALVPVIVITNQSGIARGILSESDYDTVRRRVDDLLLERGAYVDDHYHCPHLPELSGPCECRKPGLKLFEDAILEHQIDAAHSVWIGDRLRDILPSRHYGGRGILIPSPNTPPDEVEEALMQGFEMMPTLTAAAISVLDLPHLEEA